jgi:hypothetical protein
MREQINFVVGDWSDDGHGKCHSVIVESDKPVEAVREAHFAAQNLLGFDLGDFHRDYDEPVAEHHAARLMELGLIDRELLDESEGFLAPEDVAEIWVAVLNLVDPGLELATITNPCIPTLHFYGADEQGRHLRVPGYGAFQ